MSYEQTLQSLDSSPAEEQDAIGQEEQGTSVDFGDDMDATGELTNPPQRP